MSIEARMGEPMDAFEAFRLYEALGADRTLAQVADRCHVHVSRVGAWSREWGWKERLERRVAAVAESEREIVEAVKRDRAIERRRRIDEIRDEEYETGRRLVEAGRKCLATLLDKEKPYASPTGICQMLDLASKLLRLSQGMATERAEVVGDDGGPVKVEFLAALERAYGKPLPGEVVEVEVEPGTEPAWPALPSAPPPSAEGSAERTLAPGMP